MSSMHFKRTIDSNCGEDKPSSPLGQSCENNGHDHGHGDEIELIEPHIRVPEDRNDTDNGEIPNDDGHGEPVDGEVQGRHNLPGQETTEEAQKEHGGKKQPTIDDFQTTILVEDNEEDCNDENYGHENDGVQKTEEESLPSRLATIFGESQGISV
jgi:hypothetical protein